MPGGPPGGSGSAWLAATSTVRVSAHDRRRGSPPAAMTMPVRVAVSDIAAWEVVLAASIVLVATYGLVRLGGAVYSGALLRTRAKPPLQAPPFLISRLEDPPPRFL